MEEIGMMPAGAPASASGEQTTDSSSEEPNVTPEEQAQYDKFVDNGLKVIFSPKSFEAIKQRFKAGIDDPAGSLAEIVFSVVIKLQSSSEESGQQVTPDILLHGGAELLENLADAFEQAGIYTFRPEEIEQALYKAMDLYGDHANKAGKINPEVFQGEFANIIQADKTGELAKEVPGLKEKFGSGGQPNG